MTSGLTVLVPAYNEEESLAAAVPKIRENVAALSIAYEILIVNDGSTDSTGRIAEALAAADAAIPHRTDRTRGKGRHTIGGAGRDPGSLR